MVDDATTGALERGDEPGGAEGGGGAFEAGAVGGGARRHTEDAQWSVLHPVRLGAGADTHPASPKLSAVTMAYERRTASSRTPRSTLSRSLM